MVKFHFLSTSGKVLFSIENVHLAISKKTNIYRIDFFCRVFLAYDEETEKTCVVKSMENVHTNADYFRQYFRTEAQILYKLSIPKVPRIYNFNENGILNWNGGQQNVTYIAMEYAPNGEMFEYIKEKEFPEPICCYYFFQLVELVEQIHNNHICHRDIKPENICFDQNFDLMLIDFGSGGELSFIRDSDGEISVESMMKYEVGTSKYMSPELQVKKPYDGIKVDIFAMGVLLFVMRFKNFPFSEARVGNSHYKYIYQKQFQTFWNNFEKIETSDSFKNLFESLVTFNPQERISLKQAKEHKWFKICPKQSEVINYMKKRRYLLEQSQKKKFKIRKVPSHY